MSVVNHPLVCHPTGEFIMECREHVPVSHLVLVEIRNTRSGSPPMLMGPCLMESGAVMYTRMYAQGSGR